MIRFEAETYFAVASLIQQAIDVTVTQPGGALNDKMRGVMIDDLVAAHFHCEAIDLGVSQQHIESLVKSLKEGRQSCAEAERDLNTVQSSMLYEIKSRLFFHVPQEHAKLYLKPREKWEEIIDRFPGALSDVEEAWKCFALERYTGAVFHSLQIVEVGLIELGTFINVTDPISGWTSVAQRLKKIIDVKYQDLGVFEKANRPFLEQLQGTVEALKNAWRNKISHAHGKLTVMTGEEFHPDVAEEILSATRAFMRRLADGLPALGKVL